MTKIFARLAATFLILFFSTVAMSQEASWITPAGTPASGHLPPWLVLVVRFAGAAFLLVYAALAARRAIRPAATLSADDAPKRTGLGVVITTALALTWLNPHVYLDTVVLLGSIASTHGAERWWFGAGAGVASIAWFTALGLGARLLAPVFARPVAWRILDALIAVVMFGIAVSLVVGAFA